MHLPIEDEPNTTLVINIALHYHYIALHIITSYIGFEPNGPFTFIKMGKKSTILFKLLTYLLHLFYLFIELFSLKTFNVRVYQDPLINIQYMLNIASTN